MNTKWANWVVTLMLLLLTLPTSAQAQFNYTANNGAITITGYTGPGGEVTIPDTINGLPVTSIRDNAFYASSSLTSITLPDSLTSIGSQAFLGCSSLTSITVPNSVTNIGESAFARCSGLTAIIVDPLNPNYSSLDGVLFNWSQTTLIQHPAGKGGAYTVPNNVTNIGNYAFWYCTGLTTITFPDSLTSIGSHALLECTSLTSILIPNSVSSIGTRAFLSCPSLSAITVDPLNPNYSSLDGVCFDKSQTILIQCPARKAGAYAISNSVTSIGNDAFYGCTSLTSMAIPNSVTNIGAYAFYACSGLTDLTIGTNVTDIGTWAFRECSSLTGITIPNSMTSIGDYAFLYCSSLSAITVDPLNPNYSSLDGVLFNKSQTTLIQYPGGKAGGYTIPDSVTSIGADAFYYCASVTSITVPKTVTTIGNQALYNCSSLSAITVDPLNPNYSSVEGVLFNKSQTTLIQCPGGKAGAYTIPDSVTSIGDRAFQHCTSLTSIIIPKNVTRVGRYAFYSCTSLVGVYFRGYAPIATLGVFSGPAPPAVYYLPGLPGWGTTWGGRLSALWQPQLLTTNATFGVQTNQFGFHIAWATGMKVTIDACTDLAHPTWTPLQTNTLATDSFYFGDPGWTNSPRRFYRVRWP